MNSRLALLLMLATLPLYGCNSATMISPAELSKQNEIDDAVSSILFDHDIADATSYKIRRDGHVIINFASSVNNDAFSAVVLTLRQNDGIKGVSASQDGSSICSIP